MPRSRKTKVQRIQPKINPFAAGADIGAREIYVAVAVELCATPVRRFGTFTEELKQLVAWLVELKIATVAMEATSVYWIPLAELLEEAKITVCLVNPRHVQNVAGRKSDVMDCQWLQYLHAVRLLRAAFRPAPANVCRPKRALPPIEWRMLCAWPAAQGCHHAKHALGDYYRRMRAKLGAAEGLVATAHKIARILYAVMTTRRPNDPTLHEHALAETQRRRLARLHAVAKNLGFQLVPNQRTV